MHNRNWQCRCLHDITVVRTYRHFYQIFKLLSLRKTRNLFSKPDSLQYQQLLALYHLKMRVYRLVRFPRCRGRLGKNSVLLWNLTNRKADITGTPAVRDDPANLSLPVSIMHPPHVTEGRMNIKGNGETKLNTRTKEVFKQRLWRPKKSCTL